jgi:putative Mg2+ transporter-C (MgtC) family protein
MVLHLVAAAVVGGLIGWERERTRQSAGLRTHMLVALGAASLVTAALEAGMRIDEMSRVIQGVAAGVGFIGGGVVLKLTEKEEVRGLTTAAGLWMTAALGVAAGLGSCLTVVVGAAPARFVPSVVWRFEVAEGDKTP